MVIYYRWDIIAERLGFMLVFGDLVWIPFTFSIQAGNHDYDFNLDYLKDLSPYGSFSFCYFNLCFKMIVHPAVLGLHQFFCVGFSHSLLSGFFGSVYKYFLNSFCLHFLLGKVFSS